MAFNGYMRTAKCPICGKEFIVPPYTVYKLRIGKHNFTYCSYSCFRTAEKREENKPKKKRGRRV